MLVPIRYRPVIIMYVHTSGIVEDAQLIFEVVYTQEDILSTSSLFSSSCVVGSSITAVVEHYKFMPTIVRTKLRKL